MAVKKCPCCQTEAAIARKECVCGYVFLQKKKPVKYPVKSPKETPQKTHECDTRPIRVKRKKHHGDFVYIVSKPKDGSCNKNLSDIDHAENEMQIDSNGTSEQNGNNKTANNKKPTPIVEKLYPKRDRTSTVKYEECYTKSNRRELKNGSNTLIQNIRRSNTNKKSSHKASQAICKKYSMSRRKLQADERNNFKNQPSSTKLNLTETLVSNIDATIELIISSSEPSSRRQSLTEESDGDSHSEAEIVYTEDGEKLQNIKIPKKIEKHLRTQANNDPLLTLQNAHLSNNRAVDLDETPMKTSKQQDFGSRNASKPNGVDDVPLIHLKSPGPLKLKRPVGRPRKHPIVINKIKRPVGRPKKDRSLETNVQTEMETEGYYMNIINQVKRPVGRPKKDRSLEQDIERKRNNYYVNEYASPRSRITITQSLERSERLARPRSFLSPPQLMAIAKRGIQNEEFLTEDERQKLKMRKMKKDTYHIPPEKKELFGHILDEINRRILSQSFYCSI